MFCNKLGFALALLAAVVLGLGAVAQAETILLVSDAQVPGVAGGDHNDDSFVAWLEGLGHTVDTSGMNGQMKEGGTSPFAVGNESKLAALEDANLVIVSRRTNSGAYDNDRKGWNELTTAMILNSGYLTRGETSSKRWGWTTGGSGNAAAAETEMVILLPPYLAGFTVDLFDWSTVPAANNQAPKGVYLPNDDPIGAGTLLGSFDGRPMLMEFQPGYDFDAANGTSGKYGAAGANRVFLGHWGYDDGTGGTSGPGGTVAEWEDYITPGYETLLSNIIGTQIPEPATATMLVMGLLALAFYGWRRKS